MKKFTPFDGFQKTCSPDGKPLKDSMQESCNDRLTPEQESCLKACPPYWQKTGQIRCLSNGLVDFEEQDGCGNSRWTRGTDVVVWEDVGLTDCDDPEDAGEYIHMKQVNQCCETRLIRTDDKCCDPEWINAPGPVYNCEQSMLRVEQVDGCGSERLHTTGQPVAWSDTGNRRCNENMYERQEENQCGASRWTVVGPFVWVDTGNTRCDGSLIEKEQENQCGTLRWIVTNAALEWEDTGNITCSGTYVVEQENQCGATRLDDRGPILWTNTGVSQCGPVSENIENQQINQCGDLRWLDTGVNCSVANPALPTNFGGGCYVDTPTTTQSYFRLRFNNNGTGTRSILIGSGDAPFGWAPGVVDGNNYEIKVDFTFDGGPSSSYSGPDSGVWTSLGTLITMQWAVNGPTPNGGYLEGTVSIRKVGSVEPETTAEILTTFISVGVECP